MVREWLITVIWLRIQPNAGKTTRPIIVCLVSKENLPAFIFKRLVCDQAGDDNKYPSFQNCANALLPADVT